MEYTIVYTVIHGNYIIASYMDESEAMGRMQHENKKLIKSDPEMRYGLCTVQKMKVRTDELEDTFIFLD